MNIVFHIYLAEVWKSNFYVDCDRVYGTSWNLFKNKTLPISIEYMALSVASTKVLK